MEIEYDINKSQKNEQERGLSFELARQFELENAVIWIDMRENYGELRFNSIGYIGNRLYYMNFTGRADVLRIISLRKANKREVKRYAST